MEWIQKLLGRSDIWINGQLYMKRWKFMPDRLPGFRLHNIIKSDQDRELHDHPFSFLSIILKGGYFEYREDGSKKWYGPGSVLWRPGKTLHRIELAPQFAYIDRGATYEEVDDGEVPAWTFVLRSKHFRNWGFQTISGWMPWEKFVSSKISSDNEVIISDEEKKFSCKSST